MDIGVEKIYKINVGGEIKEFSNEDDAENWFIEKYNALSTGMHIDWDCGAFVICNSNVLDDIIGYETSLIGLVEGLKELHKEHDITYAMTI